MEFVDLAMLSTSEPASVGIALAWRGDLVEPSGALGCLRRTDAKYWRLHSQRREALTRASKSAVEQFPPRQKEFSP